MKVLYIPPTCIPVKGSRRSIIYDFQRNSYHYISNDLFQIINKKRTINLEHTKNKYNGYNKIIFQEYIDFLVDNEIAIWVDKTFKDNFPELKQEWDYPAYISNVIIELSIEKSLNSLLPTFINKLLCKHLYIIVKTKTEIQFIEDFLDLWNNEHIRSIELLIDFNVEKEILNNLCLRFPRLFRIVCSSSQDLDTLSTNGKLIRHSSRNLKDILSDQRITISNFVISMDLFQEAQRFNVYLNRKIYINNLGSIFNHPLSQYSVGNILHEDITVIINRIGADDFVKLWNVKKDLIEVCCDCEYRFMCIDKREPKFNTKNKMWYHDTKCGYNPYTAEWEE